MPEAAAWLILFLPLASFLLISIVIRPTLGSASQLAGYVTILAVGASFVLSLVALFSTVASDGHIAYPLHDWFSAGEFNFAVGILMDPLTAVMLVVVTGVSLMVQIYSIGYMHGDRGYTRYYASMSLFTMAMLGLVLANNLLQIFVFWELVGLGSYLLIGFWFDRPSAAAAAKKAFIITRFADFGLLLAILYLFFNGDTFRAADLNPFVITDIYHAIDLGIISVGVAQWVALGIFAGAMGKSAQFPLHTWLPDAMEGPTPVSALIHAATMVTAGVFLVARFFPLFEISPVAMNVVALIGGITAIFAASMGLVSNDIKRVLAYSTVSQLGYMMLALGVGAYGAAIFHLFTHAFFKALLFLGSGNVNHATGTFDMRYMGGLRKFMPWTYATFLIGSLSLSGIFPLSGFWSKDEILAHAFDSGDPVGGLVFLLALIAVFMTAFYMFRALFMTFNGDFKGGAEADPDAPTHGGGLHLGESPAVMLWPLLILAVPAVLIGFVANPLTDLGVVPIHWMSEFLHSNPALHNLHSGAPEFNKSLAAFSSAVALAGILLAYMMYQVKVISPEVVGRMFRPLYVLLSRKYYFDELYEDILVRRVFYGSVAYAFDWFDRSVVDALARLIGWFGANAGSALRQLQTGQLQTYGMAISIGILIIFGAFLFVRG
ncbi:MAG: NADH-quinone oxidoreductase subunit L [SAR202 cluster bacterium Casp-Chloro-G4]|nr:NADH-quinone oxidoreductase subunit L [Chloroflexota bacterium]MDA1227985.1 NADH-quinone oxidoreductase subunit L [Chloroflexota bacterium]PKB61707.1 MAG: NADH-quinone oxidoreductase subunit L [SAR202 cluster bacterium Casp-Chloro-G4]